MPIAGAVLMLLSVPVFSRRPVRAVMAETLALLGVIAAGELLWLAPALVVIYAAWILDRQLASAKSAGGQGDLLPSPTTTTTMSTWCPTWCSTWCLGRRAGGEGGSQFSFPPPFWPYFYPLLAVASAAVIGVKLVGHGLLYHAMMNWF